MKHWLIVIATLLFMGNAMNMHDHDPQELSTLSDPASLAAPTSLDLGMLLLHATHAPCQTHQGHSGMSSACCCHHSVIQVLNKELDAPDRLLCSLPFLSLQRKLSSPLIERPTPPPRFT